MESVSEMKATWRLSTSTFALLWVKTLPSREYTWLFKAQGNPGDLAQDGTKIQIYSEAQFPHLLWGVTDVSKVLLSDMESLLCQVLDKWVTPACPWVPWDCWHCRDFAAPLEEKPAPIASFIPSIPDAWTQGCKAGGKTVWLNQQNFSLWRRKRTGKGKGETTELDHKGDMSFILCTKYISCSCYSRVPEIIFQ